MQSIYRRTLSAATHTQTHTLNTKSPHYLYTCTDMQAELSLGSRAAFFFDIRRVHQEKSFSNLVSVAIALRAPGAESRPNSSSFYRLTPLWRALFDGPKLSFQIKVKFAFCLEVLESGGGGIQDVWGSVWGLHSLWWFGAARRSWSTRFIKTKVQEVCQKTLEHFLFPCFLLTNLLDMEPAPGSTTPVWLTKLVWAEQQRKALRKKSRGRPDELKVESTRTPQQVLRQVAPHATLQ